MVKGYINAKLNLKEYSVDELRTMQAEIEGELYRREVEARKTEVHEGLVDDYLEYQKLIQRLING